MHYQCHRCTKADCIAITAVDCNALQIYVSVTEQQLVESSIVQQGSDSADNLPCTCSVTLFLVMTRSLGEPAQDSGRAEFVCTDMQQ